VELVTRARRGLAIYLAIVVVFTALCQISIYRAGGTIEDHVGLVIALMWTPTLASIVARLMLREGIRDVSFRFGMRSLGGIGLALLFPIVVGFVAYGGAWLSGLATFEHHAMRWPLQLAPGPTSFLVRLLLASTLGVVFSAITAAGEEFGWRGYMVTRLIDARVPRPILVSGLIWGLWHVPLILTGQYAAGPRPWLSAIVFVASVVPFAYFAAWLRLRSGSVWPAVFAHSAWNSIIQGVFDAHTRGGGASRTTSIWVGESGLLVAATSVMLTAVLVRGAWSMRRNPRDEDEPLTIAR
jgi:uncharacterized protein